MPTSPLIGQLKFRAASAEDVKLLFDWRNDPLTRRFSTQTQELVWQEHENWFLQSLGKSDRKIFIVENKGFKVGMLRWDLDENYKELSWSVAAEFRGQGYGGVMLEQFIQWQPGPYRARIKAENQASLRMALKAGFKVSKQEKDVFFLTVVTEERQ